MTDEIFIKPGLIADHGWIFDVSFHGRHCKVMCSQEYWKKMTHGDISPMDLVRLGLEMAVERQICDGLPNEFPLEELANRIHDFEKHVRREAQTEAAGSPR
jgi:hypothetical protein